MSLELEKEIERLKLELIEAAKQTPPHLGYTHAVFAPGEALLKIAKDNPALEPEITRIIREALPPRHSEGEPRPK